MQIYPQTTPHLAKVKKLFSSLMPVIITFFGACCYLSELAGGFPLKFKTYIYTKCTGYSGYLVISP